MRTITSTLTLALLMMAGSIQAQQSSILNRPGPDDPQPGLICRIYLDGSPDAKKFPTHLAAVVATGNEFITNHRPSALNELRGFIKSQSIFYVAFGYIVLEKDTDVKFTLDKAECYVRGKNFGGGATYTQNLKAGRHPI
ncbi:MAG: hypothetical protein JNG86_00275, partial [Verrucomicrobiaceae bacterium]|nr:hypothetical protein [Verrucomicrobiaceae bacterium]